MAGREPNDSAEEALGAGKQRGGPDASQEEKAPTRPRALRSYLGELWSRMLSEQSSDEALETEALEGGPRRTGCGQTLRGWPFTPTDGIFRRCPQCRKRPNRCVCPQPPSAETPAT